MKPPESVRKKQCQVCKNTVDDLFCYGWETPTGMIKLKTVCRECMENNLIKRNFVFLNGHWVHPEDVQNKFCTPGIDGLPYFQ